MSQADHDGLERPLFRSRIQRDGHRHAGAEGGHEQIVRTGPTVRATRGHGLIRDEVMTAGGDFLDESLRTTPNDNDAFCFWHGKPPRRGAAAGPLGTVSDGPPGFREFVHFIIVTYGPFALREGVTAPRRSTPTGGGSDRTLLLECRLEQLRGALDEARAEADQARIRLAEAAAREAGETRRLSVLQDQVARARAEVAALHRRLEHSEALRANLQGHLFESEGKGDAQELMRLRREVAAARERIAASEQTTPQLRARVDELVASRETLLTRVVEWQHDVRHGDTEAVDLAEFIGSLRRAVLDLERDNALGERREAALREQLEQATIPAAEPPEPPQPPADDLVAALAAAKHPQDQVELLLRLGRRGGDDPFYAIPPWATAQDPNVRAP